MEVYVVVIFMDNGGIEYFIDDQVKVFSKKEDAIKTVETCYKIAKERYGDSGQHLKVKVWHRQVLDTDSANDLLIPIEFDLDEG